MAHVNRDVAYYVQFGLLTILICGYFAFTVLDGRIVLLGVGFALFVLAAGIAMKLGQSTTSGREMIIVALSPSSCLYRVRRPSKRALVSRRASGSWQPKDCGRFTGIPRCLRPVQVARLPMCVEPLASASRSPWASPCSRALSWP